MDIWTILMYCTIFFSGALSALVVLFVWWVWDIESGSYD